MKSMSPPELFGITRPMFATVGVKRLLTPFPWSMNNHVGAIARTGANDRIGAIARTGANNHVGAIARTGADDRVGAIARTGANDRVAPTGAIAFGAIATRLCILNYR